MITNIIPTCISTSTHFCSWHEQLRNALLIAKQFWRGRQNVTFDLCEWHQWYQFSEDHWLVNSRGVRLGIDVITEDFPNWLRGWLGSRNAAIPQVGILHTHTHPRAETHVGFHVFIKCPLSNFSQNWIVVKIR